MTKWEGMMRKTIRYGMAALLGTAPRAGLTTVEYAVLIALLVVGAVCVWIVWGGKPKDMAANAVGQ